MTLRVVGAGLGRTGTHSLQLALQQLLGAPCYHMMEVFGRPEHIPMWHAAAEGTMPDWDALFADYTSAVDWPVAAFWREISAWSPGALVLLSVRDDSDAWWTSANATIFDIGRARYDDPLSNRSCGWSRRSSRARSHPTGETRRRRRPRTSATTTPCAPRCPPNGCSSGIPATGGSRSARALDLAVPEEPFPHVNTTADFRTMAGFDT